MPDMLPRPDDENENEYQRETAYAMNPAFLERKKKLEEENRRLAHELAVLEAKSSGPNNPSLQAALPPVATIDPPRETFGLRADVWGWTYDGANLPPATAALVNNYDPRDSGKPFICPFCAKQIVDGPEVDVLCRTLAPIRVVVRVAAVVDKMLLPVQFFYRYHRECYDRRVQDMIEKTIVRLEA